MPKPTRKATGAKVAIYIPAKTGGPRTVSRLHALAKKKDRSVNYLMVEAIVQYLEKEERKKEV